MELVYEAEKGDGEYHDDMASACSGWQRDCFPCSLSDSRYSQHKMVLMLDHGLVPSAWRLWLDPLFVFVRIAYLPAV